MSGVVFQYDFGQMQGAAEVSVFKKPVRPLQDFIRSAYFDEIVENAGRAVAGKTAARISDIQTWKKLLLVIAVSAFSNSDWAIINKANPRGKTGEARPILAGGSNPIRLPSLPKDHTVCFSRLSVNDRTKMMAI